eukprot:2751983-Pyramimonas_sp.AAC.1
MLVKTYGYALLATTAKFTHQCATVDPALDEGVDRGLVAARIAKLCDNSREKSAQSELLGHGPLRATR